MALYDRADLVRRFRRWVKRPAVDQSIDLTADIYPALSDAQRRLAGMLSIHAPEANRAVKQLMTTSDSGLTYNLAASPIGPVNIYYDLRSAMPLVAGEAWQAGADFEWEGDAKIRMIGNVARSFPNGAPYAHYVPAPSDIDATTEPSILPAYVRVMIPIMAAIDYVSEGGMGDPGGLLARHQALWNGDPNMPGDVGILGELKLRYGEGTHTSRPWWQSPDLSDLPIGFNS